MPLWDAIKKHLIDEAGKYVALLFFAVLGIVAWQSWDRARASLLNFLKDALLDTDPYHKSDKSDKDPAIALAISNFQQGVLGLVKDTLLEKDPDKLPNGKNRNADLARAISEFQKGVVRFVGNGAFVGYVQAGKFELPYPAQASPAQAKLPSKKAGTRFHDSPDSFQIFAGNNSHVYLEFDVSPSFDSENYHIQLNFDKEPVCTKHIWTRGFNKVEFEVTDLSSRTWEFFWDCQEANSPSTPKEHRGGRLKDEGHKGQLIPVRLAIINELSVASLEEAAGPSSRTGSQISADTAPNGSADTALNGNEPKAPQVTVGYIAVVSPLIEDVKSK